MLVLVVHVQIILVSRLVLYQQPAFPKAAQSQPLSDAE